VPRLLYIVARRNQLVYASLKQTFANDPDVEVILDRRHGERRQRVSPEPVDRRERDRRTVNIGELLNRLGWAVVDARSDVEGRP
jgi:hypothetical protein